MKKGVAVSNKNTMCVACQKEHVVLSPTINGGFGWESHRGRRLCPTVPSTGLFGGEGWGEGPPNDAHCLLKKNTVFQIDTYPGDTVLVTSLNTGGITLCGGLSTLQILQKHW